MFLFLFIPFLLFSGVKANELNELFEFSKLVLNSPKQSQLKFSDFNITRCEREVDLNISNELDYAKYRYYNNDLGISFDVGGNINDNSGKKSLYAGFTWRVLNDGVWEHQNKADIISLENRLKKLDNKHINTSFVYFNDYNFIIYFYNKKKIELLDKYLTFLNLKLDIFKKRYFYHQINLEKLLLIKQNIQDIKNLQNNYKNYNKKVICKNNISGDIPTFDLNYQKILDVIQDKAKRKNHVKIRLKNEIIDKKYDRLNDWTLNLYANRELLDDKGDNFGFKVSIPLFKDPSELRVLEKLKTYSDVEENKVRLFLYLQKNYYVFRYKLSDLIKMKFKLAYVTAQLKRAKLRYAFKIGNDNLDRIISNIDSLFAIKLQLLDIKQQLLLQAYSLLYNLNLDFEDKYIKKIKVDTDLKLRKGNRSLYIWANGFKKYDNKILIELCKLKNIKTVLVSVSKNQNFDKLENFIYLAKLNHINIQFLIGNNSWIYPKNRSKIDKKLNFLRKYDNYVIHLDIEPQAMPNLKHNKEKYLKMYLDMLEYIHTNYPMYKINIAIPTYYPLEYVIKMAEYVDKIYLMAYEYKDIEHLIRKVNKYKFLSHKLVTVFNCKEFKNEYELESNIDKFIEKSGYKNIGLHNLKEYIKVSQ